MITSAICLKEMKRPTILYILLGICFSCASNFNKNDSLNSNPNIIIVLADDLGYDHLGCYGQKIIHTPNIDQMATEGLRFTQFYSGASVCAPSRNTLLTGQHTGHARVRWNRSSIEHSSAPKRRVPLQDEDVTIAELLKRKGYITGITGKWGLGEANTSGEPNNQGFDEWFGYLNQENAHNYYPEYLWHNQDSIILEGNLMGKKQTYSHNLIHNFALDFIDKYKDSTFFLYCAYTLPHGDFEIPDLGKFADSTAWSNDEQAYAAMVELLDQNIAEIEQKLQEYGISEKTLLVFMSDNGSVSWQRFDHDGFRANKGSLYEGGIRVPMIVKYPGKIEPGVTNQLAYFPDVFATLAEMTGTGDNSKYVDGKSLVAVLFNQELLDERMLYWEQLRSEFQQALRMNQWKMIKTGNDIELYNIEDDPGEKNNVAVNNSETIDKLVKVLDTIRSESIFWPVY